jgi:MFS family permease
MNETPDKPDARWPVMLRALGHRDFRIFFFGQWISLIGTWMQAVAEGWLVYRLTHSAALLGVAGFCAQAPIALLSPLGGLAADRWPRRKVLFITQIAALLLALTLGVLTLTGTVEVWMVFTLGALLGAVNAFDIPTRQSFFADMVGREDLINAIALNSAMFNAARVVGPAVAGVLVAAVGEGWCFIINAASYLAVIGGYLMIRARGLPLKAKGGHTAFIAEGFRFAWEALPVRALLLMLALVCLVGTPYGVLMPIFADAILHGGPGGLGLLMGASGLGALAGALLLTARTEIRGLGNWVAFGAAGFGVMIGLFAVSKIFWLSALLLLPAGCAIMVQMGATNTLIQTMVPDRLRGRIMAVYAMTFTGAAPAGALLAGAAAQRFGAPLTVLGGGVLCVAGALVFLRALPAMREPARTLINSAAAESG